MGIGKQFRNRDNKLSLKSVGMGDGVLKVCLG